MRSQFREEVLSNLGLNTLGQIKKKWKDKHFPKAYNNSLFSVRCKKVSYYVTIQGKSYIT